MRSFIQFFAAVLSIIIIGSCNGSKNNIEVISTNFGEEISRTQNLIFRFNAQMIEEEALNIWQNNDLIKFSPDIKGKVRWISKNELMFTPEGRFGICKAYKAELNAKIAEKCNVKKPLSRKAIEFHTPYLRVEETNAYWSRNKASNRAEIILNTHFNNSVVPARLTDKAKIDVNGKAYGFEMRSTATGEQQTICITDKKALPGNCDITLTVGKGLNAAGSNYQTTEALDHKIMLSGVETLDIQNITTSYEEQIGTVKITTSQELESIPDAITLYPAVKTTIEFIENQIIIKGDFVENTGYTLTIGTNLKGTLGGTLKAEYSNNIRFGEMPAAISFVNKQAQYISNKGSQNIALNIVNIDKVNLRITKIYQNNLLLYLNNMQGYSYDGYYDEEGEYISTSSEYYYEDYNEQYSSEVLDREMSTKDMPKNNNQSLLNVNLGDDKKFKGVYNIRVVSLDNDYISASKLVSVSDIGILARTSKNDIMVMANSLINSEPLEGVEISLISTNNQNVYKLKTDGKGIAHFSDLEQKTSGFKIAMITAEKGDDFNYMLLRDTRVETARFETDGITENKAGWWAFIYTDRNIYRPGETLHVNSIIRNEQMGNVKSIPVIVKLVMPNGRVYLEKSVTTNEQGAAPADFEVSDKVMTGNYTLEVYNTNDVLLNSQNISIEEFVPDKIKVNQSISKTAYGPGEEIRYTGEALTFFGPASADRNYECEFVFKSMPFQADKFKDYQFNIRNKIKFEPDVREGKTDANGLFTQTCRIPEEWQNTGYISGKVLTTVFDENGRPVNRSKNFDLYTQTYFFGIGYHDEWVGTNAPSTFSLVALNKDQTLVSPSAVKIEIIRYEWQNLLEKYYGEYRYNSKPIEKVVNIQSVVFKNGKADIRYTPPISGEYEIRVLQPGSDKGYTYSSFYAYTWGSTSSSSFEVNQEGEVTIEADREKYNNGDDAKLLFKTPFNGKLLVTVDRNKVLEYHILEVKDKSASLELEMKDEYVPNVYISATLIKQSANSEIPLTVAHGLKNLTVIRKKTELPVSITAVDNSRSKTKQKITVKTEPNAEVTIAIVDEGILSVKNGTTPDPFNYFYQKRALEVTGYDLYARLFPEIITGASGGDADYEMLSKNGDMEKRVNPLSVTRFKPLSLWSGVLKANGSGVAEFTANIPQFYGAVRIMAVAYKDKAFGNGEKSMKIFDPMVISTSLPRFLSPGDEITMAVSMMNTTNGAASAKATVNISGPLELVNTDNTGYTIPGGKEKMALFTLRAKPDIGKATVDVKVSALKEVFREVTDIAVRPAGGLQHRSEEGFVKPGETQTINLNIDYMGTPELYVMVDKTPLAQLGNRMRDLLQYPHGCAEQTISTAFPQVYFMDYAKAVGQFTHNDKMGNNELNPVFNVNEALKKINALAADDGNISYWPGQYYSYNLFINAYALHFMSECEKKGYNINKTLKSRLITLCTNATGNLLERKEYVMDESGKYAWKLYISREKVYALYALSVAGSPNKSGMNYCKNNSGKLHNSSKYVLAATYALAGDISVFRSILPKTYLRENDFRYYYDDYSSPVRDKALVLNALIEADINNAQVLPMVKSLLLDIKNAYYCNTNEMAFSILALGKFSERIPTGGNAKALVMVDGKSKGTFTDKTLNIRSKGKAGVITISNTGKSNVYYSSTYEGISISGNIVEEDKGMTVRRYFFDRYGNAVNPENIRQNDLVIIKIVANSSVSGGCKNVVITDILPAGLEIENPRVTAVNELSWMSNQGYPTHTDISDDRINYYLDLGEGESTILYYMCRAVSKGRFILGPVQAEAMYDGSVHSYNGKGILTVN